MTGNSFLILSMIAAFASAVIGLGGDKIPSPGWIKTLLFFIAAILALVSGILNLYGSKIVESENAKELKEQYDNHTNDLKEAFGLMSHRTVEQFLSEKVPSKLSEEQVTILIRKALNKWIEDSIVKDVQSISEGNVQISYQKELRFKEGDTSSIGCWVINSDIRFKRNWFEKAGNQSTYYDAYIFNEETPNDHKLIHAIIDYGEGLPEGSFITNVLTEKSRDLYLKYCNWYEAKRSYQTTHQTYSHIIIIVTRDRDKSMDELITEEMNLWAGSERGARINSEELSIVLYNETDLKNEKIVFE